MTFEIDVDKQTHHQRHKKTLKQKREREKKKTEQNQQTKVTTKSITKQSNSIVSFSISSVHYQV